ncbi:MAG TPA: DUF3141 domain-containing protein [Tepidisphaeraceae bacterium]|nr:DUF3141 domain-containing protein [Tepidisphaeraceae bacterium]
MTTDLKESLLSKSPVQWFSDWWEYCVDASQRSILFWDVLRQRGNTYHEHQESGKPAVLAFEYELVLDGRKLEPPCNYALLHIKPQPGQKVDPKKRPYVVVDPRAGHGPGIGGFKVDSQVGVAQRAGHPVYFVTFFPDPVPGQRLRDVAAAEAQFIEEVARRHPQAQGKPCVVGNCQAGWAVAALAATRPEIMGPILLNGAPLSYWSGSGKQNPMRYSGGLMGGKWAESLTCDLGDGLFDGAHLVSNFEKLDPANTLWSKYYDLYAKVDTEAPRFLGFEKWWGGYFLMNREEIDAIVSELFIGNKLARRQIVSEEGEALDLRNIKSPIVVFASYGDNITPPQQALNWIEDVYGDEKGIISANQTVVYLLHDDIGHLGIFVSGRVAGKEHKELVGTLEMIDALPAGLYEMIIEGKRPDDPNTDWEAGNFTVRFESRTIDDIHSLEEDTRQDEQAFQTVADVSEFNDRSYKTFVSPWVRSFSTPLTADMLRRLHPLRLQHWFASDLNPMFSGVGKLAEQARSHRQPVSKDNSFLAWERTVSNAIVTALDGYRNLRDSFSEGIFKVVYGPAGLGALFPPKSLPPPSSAFATAAALPAEQFESGGMLAAVLRIVAGSILNRGVFDRRSALIFASLREQSQFKNVSHDQVKELFRTQAQLLRQDWDRAVNSLAVLLPRRESRLIALEVVRRILMIAPDEITIKRPMAKKLLEILKVDPGELQVPGDVGLPIEVTVSHMLGKPAPQGTAR